ncbi:MAG: hypothetical protein ABMB14_11140 [Myxococcota bacterium]
MIGAAMAGWLWAWLGCGSDPRQPLDAPWACAPGCARVEAAREAVVRAVPVIARNAADPGVDQNLDVALCTGGIAGIYRSRTLDRLRAGFGPDVVRPGDPRRRLVVPTARLDEDPSGWWAVGQPGIEVHQSQVLVEVLYCPEYGLRRSTIDWICGPFRDGGGRGSTHAAWFLDLAVDAGCVPRADTCLDPVVDELVTGALGWTSPPTTDLDRDLLAEQILFAVLAGSPPEPLAAAVDRLLASQQPDGGFGAPDRIGAHATFTAGWALAAWSAAAR